MTQEESRRNRSALQSFVVLVILLSVYSWILLRTSGHIEMVIHILCIIGIGRMLLDLFEWWWRGRTFARGIAEPADWANPKNVKDGPKVVDEVLGDLYLVKTSDGYWWQTELGDHEKIEIQIAGKDHPDVRIVNEVRKLACDWDSFSLKLKTLIANECASNKCYSEDIAALKIGSIKFLWPTKPWQAEVYFYNAPSGRLWVCSFEHGDLS